MYDSSPHIFDNEIHENVRAGVVLTGSSYPKIDKNSIYGNTTAGVMVTGNSYLEMKNNKIYSNYYQVSGRGLDAKAKH